jgi:hypothetical protein
MAWPWLHGPGRRVAPPLRLVLGPRQVLFAHSLAHCHRVAHGGLGSSSADEEVHVLQVGARMGACGARAEGGLAAGGEGGAGQARDLLRATPWPLSRHTRRLQPPQAASQASSTPRPAPCRRATTACCWCARRARRRWAARRGPRATATSRPWGRSGPRHCHPPSHAAQPPRCHAATLPCARRPPTAAPSPAAVAVRPRSPTHPLIQGGDLTVVHVAVPHSYAAANWPLTRSAVSASGSDVAVAGRHGLAVYNRASERCGGGGPGGGLRVEGGEGEKSWGGQLGREAEGEGGK